VNDIREIICEAMILVKGKRKRRNIFESMSFFSHAYVKNCIISLMGNPSTSAFANLGEGGYLSYIYIYNA